MKRITPLFSVVIMMVFSSILYAAGKPQLEKAIQQGKDLFIHGTFGGNGKTCETCHTDGGIEPGRMPGGMKFPSLANAATIFPRFNPKVNKVITLEDQIGNCIVGALHGKPPAYGSAEMNALVSYITSLSQGKPMDMGGKPQ
ncbi:MAG: cytochrome C [Deltaproteobacteria bacterium]|nr:cytochrome C [Deltaproteobacteria bacterium]MCL5792189.1 cytochrome C [Deltaproteobacteria bacterium]